MKNKNRMYVHYAIYLRTTEIQQEFPARDWDGSHISIPGPSIMLDFKESHFMSQDEEYMFGEFIPWGFEFGISTSRSLTKEQRKKQEHDLRHHYFTVWQDEAADAGPYGRII